MRTVPRVLNGVLVALLGVVFSALVVGSPAQAAGVHPNMCPQDPYYTTTQSGSPWYSSIGSAAGKYNGSTVASTLSISLTQSTQRSTTVEAGASMSVSWGIAQVEASFSYSVTTTTQTGKTVTDTVVVPGHYYGYAQPKVEYRKFHIQRWGTKPDCSSDQVLNDYGYIDAITAYPFFSECTSTAACTPKP